MDSGALSPRRRPGRNDEGPCRGARNTGRLTPFALSAALGLMRDQTQRSAQGERVRTLNERYWARTGCPSYSCSTCTYIGACSTRRSGMTHKSALPYQIANQPKNCCLVPDCCGGFSPSPPDASCRCTIRSNCRHTARCRLSPRVP